jgi:hypothetical protein
MSTNANPKTKNGDLPMHMCRPKFLFKFMTADGTAHEFSKYELAGNDFDVLDGTLIDLKMATLTSYTYKNGELEFTVKAQFRRGHTLICGGRTLTTEPIDTCSAVSRSEIRRLPSGKPNELMSVAVLQSHRDYREKQNPPSIEEAFKRLRSTLGGGILLYSVLCNLCAIGFGIFGIIVAATDGVGSRWWEFPLGLLFLAVCVFICSTPLIAHVFLKNRRPAGVTFAYFGAWLFLLTPVCLGLFFHTIPAMAALRSVKETPLEEWNY